MGYHEHGETGWTTEMEMKFILSLPKETQIKYKESFLLRERWGTLDKWAIFDFLNRFVPGEFGKKSA